MTASPPSYRYKKIFRPPDVYKFPEEGREGEVADARERPPYVYHPDIVLAINVALACGRPLLVRGGSGCGKSTLARNAAKFLKRDCHELVVTSRTQAKDFLYEVDLINRLHEAQAAARDGAEFDRSFDRFIIPGVLWRAFDPNGAAEQDTRARCRPQPQTAPNTPAVVLIDEIDKADPDVPNNLLVPLGSYQFQIDEPVKATPRSVSIAEKMAPLVFITTNGERQLPTAFLRRCVDLQLPSITRSMLVRIGAAHLPEKEEVWIEGMLESILGKKDKDEKIEMSPAEFIDTLKAADRLNISPQSRSKEWEALKGITVYKHDRERRA